MIIIIIISSLFLIIAAAANAVMDTLAHHYATSIFARLNPLFWNPAQSWKNKYKNSAPEQGAKFPGSTTLLVFLTDAWHLFKFVMLNSYLLAVTIPAWVLIGGGWIWFIGIFAGLKLLQGIIFSILYNNLLITSP